MPCPKTPLRYSRFESTAIPWMASLTERWDEMLAYLQHRRGMYILSSWWFQPVWQILVKMGIFPNRSEDKKYLKPPPSYSQPLVCNSEHPPLVTDERKSTLSAPFSLMAASGCQSSIKVSIVFSPMKRTNWFAHGLHQHLCNKTTSLLEVKTSKYIIDSHIAPMSQSGWKDLVAQV